MNPKTLSHVIARKYCIMGFEGLVSDDPPPSREEMKRLQNVIAEYEIEKIRLRDERDSALSVAAGVQEGFRARQEEINSLHKTINSLRQSLKIEKKAGDGLNKKMQIIDIDLKLHKEERVTMIEEQIMNRKKVADLERKLLDDRSKRLQNIHENDIFRKKCATLEARNKVCEEYTRKSAAELLVKVEKLQNATEIMDKQKRTIEAQGAEMLDLNREVTMLKEAQKSMTDEVLKLERRLAIFKKERDSFEQENFRLRREMVNTASASGSIGSKAAAFDSFRPGSKQGHQRASTSIGGSRGGSSLLPGYRDVKTAGGGVPNHSFQFGEWSENFAGSGGTGGFSPTGGRSLSPPPVRRAMTSEGTRSQVKSPARTTSTYLAGEENSLPAEMSQVTMDTALTEAGAGGEEGEGNDILEQSSDTFASAQSVTPGARSSGAKGNKPKGLAIDASLGETTPVNPAAGAALRPLTGTSPLPSPMGSPMVRYTGPMNALQSPGSRGPGSRSGKSSRDGKRYPAHGLLTSPDRSKAKLHERGRAGFVGQGLGMINSPTPKYSAGGSAKQVLAKILAES